MNRILKGSSLFVAALLLGVVGCANTGTKTGAYVDDSWITTKVKSDMVADHDVSAHNITVNTTKGVVTLSGTAATAQESTKAAEIARGVAGVKGVENDIRVQ
jgi:osmotically-inducible protein OsmY